MLRFLFGVFATLHGLVHLWFVALSQGLVEFEPDMGWTSESWLLSGLLGQAATKRLAGVVFSLATVGFVAGGIGLLVRAGWWRTVLMGAAIFSTGGIFLYWDGRREMIVQKGLIAVLINAGTTIALQLVDWA
jgi:hypothetical protein